MTSASFFAKTSHILFGAHEAMRAQCPDLLAGLELAKDAEADFASVCLLEDGLQCRAGEGDGQPYPLRDVLALCTRIALPLCLFVRECADEKTLFACLAARDELPLLLASRDRTFLQGQGRMSRILSQATLGERKIPARLALPGPWT